MTAMPTQTDDAGQVTDPLTPDQMRGVIGAGARAPSTHNTQPWRFHAEVDTVEILADNTRALPAIDPDHRELRMACGAAAFNVRLAVMVLDRVADLTPCPAADQPDLLASVQVGPRRSPPAWVRRLYGAIPRRHTNRWPFLDTPVPTAHGRALQEAATAERCWLHVAGSRAEVVAIADLVRAADGEQRHDEDLAAELAKWSQHTGDRQDGVPLAAGGPRPEPHDLFVPRDFGQYHGPARPTGKDYEEHPLVVVLSASGDRAVDHVLAGVAMQRVLLTATSLGLTASFFSQPIEVPGVRAELRRLIGDWGYPQMVLRIGYGTPAAATPRRPVTELIG
jgi:hypothetical protein